MASKDDRKILEVFGSDNLHTIPETIVELWDIPQRSKDFLTNVGLPDEPSLLIECARGAADLQILSEECDARCAARDNEGRFRPLARQAHRYICLDEATEGGRVVSVDTEDGPRAIVLINTTVELFGRSLAMYRDICKKSLNQDGEERVRLGHVFDAELRRLDPGAFVGERNDLSWWAIITEQMKDDLM